MSGRTTAEWLQQSYFKWDDLDLQQRPGLARTFLTEARETISL